MARRAGATLTEKLTGRLRREIRSGRLRPGEALPSEGRLCSRFGVSRVTVRRGLAELKRERLVESRAGVGHFVTPGAAPESRTAGGTEVIYVHDVGRAAEALGPLGAGIFAGVIEEAGLCGLDVFQCCLEPARLRHLIEEKGTVLRGVLFDWNDPDMARFMIGAGVPFVVVEGDFDELPVGAVVQDDAGGTLAALEHLAGLEHQRIGYLGSDDTWVHRRRRLGAFREFHLRRGLPLDEGLVTLVPFEEGMTGREQAEKLLALEPRPGAVYVANRELLPALLEAAAARDLRVPGDLSIVVWGQPDPGAPGEDVTFVGWDRREMGRLAVRTLAERAQRGAREKMQVLVPTKLVERASTSNFQEEE